MADGNTQTALQKSLECSVCLVVYDNEDHLPKALRCLHTFCKSCIDDLDSGAVVKCPMCRENTGIEDVRTNYSLLDMLDAICPECRRRDQEVHCGHCGNTLCQSCFENHLKNFPAEVASKFQLLKEDIDSISEITGDASKFNTERAKANEVLKEIRDSFVTFHEFLDRCQTDLEKKVLEVKMQNIKSLKDWRANLDTILTSAYLFVDKIEGPVSKMTKSSVTLDEMIKIDEECSSIRETLKVNNESCPEFVPYHFQETMDVSILTCANIGEIIHSATTGASSGVSQHMSPVPGEIIHSATTGTSNSGVSQHMSPVPGEIIHSATPGASNSGVSQDMSPVPDYTTATVTHTAGGKDTGMQGRQFLPRIGFKNRGKNRFLPSRKK